MKSIILLVEDDILKGQTLKDFFEYNDFSVLWAKDGNSAIKLFQQTPPSIILLDVIVPHKNGFEVATEILKSNRIVPIIFMTGTALEEEKHIEAYKLNCANYIEKPFVPQIVLAQIRSLLMLLNVREYSFSNLTINIDNQFLIINDKKIKLREKDVAVLILLIDNVNTVVSRNEKICAVWKHNLPQVSNLLNSAISRLKKELKHIPNIQIETIYGIGYKLEVIGEQHAAKK